MNIEINDDFKELLEVIAKRQNVTSSIVLESAFIFTNALTQLSIEKQNIIKQWVDDEALLLGLK